MCLFLFLFSLLWEVGHRGSCCDLCQSVLPMFSSQSFIASGLLIHFEFIFGYGVRKRSDFYLSPSHLPSNCAELKYPTDLEARRLFFLVSTPPPPPNPMEELSACTGVQKP
ncbi:unnamed protein product [Rangifer tarandus platyrhynchus]|uniref:Uncharacterized protein n=1 Tax=Rangifer tarandus platyrhynchus TaxID=3082113 RepID=A0AC59YMG7_RANTA